MDGSGVHVNAKQVQNNGPILIHSATTFGVSISINRMYIIFLFIRGTRIYSQSRDLFRPRMLQSNKIVVLWI